MKLKRLIASLILCASLLALAVPVSASSSFSDVNDPTTAVNADVLRLMGVVSGSGGNNFSPSANLTRAEFCVMAVKVMGRGDEVPIHTTRTIFSDVTARHWARGYINLASSITLGGGEDNSQNRLISGVGNGQFLPDSQITLAQAVTILTRMLGYGDDKVGSVWPMGYLNMAASLGVTRGVSTANYNAPITRATAAQLFVNLLSAKTSGGQKYYETLGSVSENVIILALNVTANDKTPGAIRTSKGTYLPAAEGVVPTALQGRRGTLVLNDRQEIAAFIPDSSTSVTITLGADAQATYLQGANGTRYAIAPDTPSYTSDTESPDTTYEKLWVELHAGAQITLFLDAGQVIGLYYNSSEQEVTDAVVVTGALNRASFHDLTGGVTDYTIQKNGQVISLDDIQLYDVVTYNAVTNILTVSDLRLTCVYESASPNPATPATVHALGHDFPVLSCALESIGNSDVGKTVTLLLTADGKVAGMTDVTSKTRSTAVGLASESTVEMMLPSGGCIELTSSEPLSSRAQGQVVSISSSQSGVINAIRLADRSVSHDLDLKNLTLGSYTVAPGAFIFERTDGSTVVQVKRTDLDVSTISGDNIATYRLNTSGMVDVIVLNSATGDSYQYGQYVVKSTWTKEPVTDEQGNYVLDANGNLTYQFKELRELSFQNGEGTIELPHVGYIGKSGAYVGIALDGSGKLRSKIELTAVSGVSRADFFTSDGATYVKVSGQIYPVASNVQAFNNDTKSWFTGDDVLSAIRVYSNDLTLYVDPIGHKVRVIAAN